MFISCRIFRNFKSVSIPRNSKMSSEKNSLWAFVGPISEELIVRPEFQTLGKVQTTVWIIYIINVARIGGDKSLQIFFFTLKTMLDTFLLKKNL